MASSVQTKKARRIQLYGIPSSNQLHNMQEQKKQREAVKCVPIVIDVTEAERSVLVELTRDGASNRVIANRLGIEVETVKSHLKNVMCRLPTVNDRTALAIGLIRESIQTRIRPPVRRLLRLETSLLDACVLDPDPL